MMPVAAWGEGPCEHGGARWILADLGWRLVVRDLDPRGDDPTRLDATARLTPTDLDPAAPAIVVRLWNPRSAGGSAGR